MERQTDLEKMLHDLRAGFLSENQIRKASSLEHPIARQVFPNERLLRWEQHEHKTSVFFELTQEQSLLYCKLCFEYVEENLAKVLKTDSLKRKGWGDVQQVFRPSASEMIRLITRFEEGVLPAKPKINHTLSEFKKCIDFFSRWSAFNLYDSSEMECFDEFDMAYSSALILLLCVCCFSSSAQDFFDEERMKPYEYAIIASRRTCRDIEGKPLSSASGHSCADVKWQKLTLAKIILGEIPKPSWKDKETLWNEKLKQIDSSTSCALD